jgi:hypothetical protein
MEKTMNREIQPSPIDLSYQQRQRIYLQSEIETQPVPGYGVAECFTQIPRLALGVGPLDPAMIQASLDVIAARRDCAEFALAGLLRMLYRFPTSPLLTADLRAGIEAATLKFCYWYDQPGMRGMCFHTENHQILFHGCEMLAGQLYPDRIFENDGHTGEWHAAHGAALANQWIDQRARFGFSEWLSNCYFEEDLLALLNLADFAADAEIRRKATQLVDMLLLEIALHQFNGVLVSTHGRTYTRFILDERKSPTSAIAWLVFGLGAFQPRTNFALAALCTSDYMCPPVIYNIAHHRPAELVLRESHGLNVADAPAFGLHPDRPEDNMFFWACQTSRHPAVRATSLHIANVAQDPWLVDFVNGVDQPLERCRALVESGGAVFDGDAVNTALSEANLITFRTPDYQLSCAQDFRPGRPGYQQHIWQAALDDQAVVFTTHPGTDDEDGAHTSRPNFWAGNRWLPRAAQHRNVAVCIHHVPTDDPRPYSHAWFPRSQFDRVEQAGPWVVAQKGSAYLALYTQHPAHWSEQGPYAGIELRVESADTIWICELGSAAESGSFEDFLQRITTAQVHCDGLNVTYQSPSLGVVRFGWTGPLTVGGEVIDLHNYPRFDNPFVQAEIGDRSYLVRFGDAELAWDFSDRKKDHQSVTIKSVGE